MQETPDAPANPAPFVLALLGVRMDELPTTVRQPKPRSWKRKQIDAPTGYVRMALDLDGDPVVVFPPALVGWFVVGYMVLDEFGVACGPFYLRKHVRVHRGQRFQIDLTPVLAELRQLPAPVGELAA